MGKPFEVKAVNGGRIHAISFSLDATRPDDYYEALQKALSKLKIDGDILLDLLACNGVSRRFFTVRFDGERLLLQSMRMAKEDSLDPSLLKACSSFYMKNTKKLGKSVLSTPAIKRLGMVQH